MNAKSKLPSSIWPRCSSFGRRFVRLAIALALGIPALVYGQASSRTRVNPPSLEELEARARADSLDPEVHFRLAARYYSLKRFDDEERELRSTIAIDPRYAPAYLWLGDLPFDRRPKLWRDVRKGKVAPEYQQTVEESQRLWRRAFLIDPLVDFRVQGAQAPPEDMVVVPEYGSATTNYLVRLGLGAFGAARYELAYGALDLWAQRAFANKPIDSIPDFLFLYRGLAAGHQRWYTRAIADFQVLLARSLKTESSDTLLPFPLRTSDYRYILGVLHQSWGKRSEALLLYQQALSEDLGLYMAHVRMAQLYATYNAWDQAIAEAQRAEASSPDDFSATRELGVLFRQAGRLSQAEEVLGRAVTTSPRDPLALYHLGLVQQQAGKTSDAREALARFIAMAPASRYERELADARQRITQLAP